MFPWESGGVVNNTVCLFYVLHSPRFVIRIPVVPKQYTYGPVDMHDFAAFRITLTLLRFSP